VIVCSSAAAQHCNVFCYSRSDLHLRCQARLATFQMFDQSVMSRLAEKRPCPLANPVLRRFADDLAERSQGTGGTCNFADGGLPALGRGSHDGSQPGSFDTGFCLPQHEGAWHQTCDSTSTNDCPLIDRKLLESIDGLLQQHYKQLVAHMDYRFTGCVPERLAKDYLKRESGNQSNGSSQPPISRNSCSSPLGGQRRSFRTWDMRKAEKIRAISEEDVAAQSKDTESNGDHCLHHASCRTKKCGPSWRCKFAQFIDSTWCEVMLIVIIICSAIALTIEVQYAAVSLEEEVPESLDIITMTFTMIFLWELVMRILASSHAFCCSSQWAWNGFDMIIACITIYEVIVRLFGESSMAGSSKAIKQSRVLRLARLVRVLRIVRLPRIFRALRMVVLSMVRTVKSLFWTMVVLFTFLVLFGVLFTQAATNHFMDQRAKIEDLKAGNDELFLYFGDVSRSVLTLFKSVTGGMDWQDAARQLNKIDHFWGAVFVLFIAFAVLAVLNIITGVVLSSALESAIQDRDMILQDHIARKERYVKALQRLFSEIDSNNKGRITLQEFENVMKGDRLEDITNFFESIDISIDSAWHLFCLLDSDYSDKDHRIGLDSFVDGCLRLQGAAKAVDLHLLRYESRWTMTRITQILRFLERGGGLDERVLRQVTAALRDKHAGPAHMTTKVAL